MWVPESDWPDGDLDRGRTLTWLAGQAAFFDPAQPLYVTRAPGRLDVMGGIADYSGALQRGNVGEEKVRNQYGHRAAEMRIRRHDGIVRAFGRLNERADQVFECLLKERDTAAKVQTQVERDLLVSRAARVQTLAGVADQCD